MHKGELIVDFYRKMIIKILEASETGREARVLKILKSGYDLTQKERRLIRRHCHNLSKWKLKLLEPQDL